jgi:medium-chain acyl-[acyl-carrier-protein] hydrolase
LCLPHAGAGASIFRGWSARLAEVEVVGLQLPGREGRMGEPPIPDMNPLVQALAAEVEVLLDRPYAIFGHSMGSMVGFELARALRRGGAPRPHHLFVGGHHAPQLPDRRPPIHALPDHEFLEQLRRRYDGIPSAVLAEPELMALFLPTLRADLRVIETYAYSAEPALDCPIAAFGGVRDGETTAAELEAWGEQTRAEFSLVMLDGDHFFVQTHQQELLDHLAARLRAGREQVLGRASDDLDQAMGTCK